MLNSVHNRDWSNSIPGRQIPKGFRDINISMKTSEFLISVWNLSICAVNDEILKNVINIRHYSQYPRWPANGEPLNTFGILELLFPISKKGICSCFVPILKMYHSCYLPKSIVLVSFQNESFILGITVVCLHTTYYVANGSLIN